MNILRNKENIYIAEIDGKYFVFQGNEKKHQVYSVLPSDCPKGGGVWCGAFTEEGIKYVARGRSKSAAEAGYYRLLRPLLWVDRELNKSWRLSER